MTREGEEMFSPFWPHWFAELYLVNVVSPTAAFDGVPVRSASIVPTNLMEAH